MDGAKLLDRVRSLVTGTPFDLVEAPTPFSFRDVPAQLASDSVRVEVQTVGTAGGFAYSEERFDDVDVWVARQVDAGDPQATYRTLTTLAASVTSAVIRDGCGDGEFAVLDSGRRVDLEQPTGSALMVLRLTLPVSYMATV